MRTIYFQNVIRKYLSWWKSATKFLFSIFLSRNISQNNQTITKWSYSWNIIAGLKRCHYVHLVHANMPICPICNITLICFNWCNFDIRAPTNDQESVILNVTETQEAMASILSGKIKVRETICWTCLELQWTCLTHMQNPIWFKRI